MFAPVAQLDRASVFGTEGWGFESLRVRWIFVENAAQFARNVLIDIGVCGVARVVAFQCGTTLCATLFALARTASAPPQWPRARPRQRWPDRSAARSFVSTESKLREESARAIVRQPAAACGAKMMRFSLNRLLLAVTIVSMGCALGTVSRTASSPVVQNEAILVAGALVGAGLGSLVRPIAGTLTGAFLGMILLPMAIVVWLVITSLKPCASASRSASCSG